MNAREYRLTQKSSLVPQEYYWFLKVYRRRALGNLKRLWFCAVVILGAELLAPAVNVPSVVVRCLSMGTLAFASCAMFVWFEHGWFETLLPGRSWMDNSLKYAMYLWLIMSAVVGLSQFGGDQINLLADSRNWVPIFQTAQMVWRVLISFLGGAGKGFLVFFLIMNIQQRSFLDHLYDSKSKRK